MPNTIMTIDEEIEHFIKFLSHPAGFDVDMAGLLQIRPIDEGSPPTHWAVDWQEKEDSITFDCEKEFSTLREAVQFFVEKRRYMCLGLDFEAVYLGSTPVDAEIENE